MSKCDLKETRIYILNCVTTALRTVKYRTDIESQEL